MTSTQQRMGVRAHKWFAVSMKFPWGARAGTADTEKGRRGWLMPMSKQALSNLKKVVLSIKLIPTSFHLLLVPRVLRCMGESARGLRAEEGETECQMMVTAHSLYRGIGCCGYFPHVCRWPTKKRSGVVTQNSRKKSWQHQTHIDLKPARDSVILATSESHSSLPFRNQHFGLT